MKSISRVAVLGLFLGSVVGYASLGAAGISPGEARAGAKLSPGVGIPSMEAWAADLKRNLEASEYAATVNARGLQAPNRQNGLRTYFYPSGVRIEDRRTSRLLARFELSAIGRGASVTPVEEGTVAADGARVEIARDGLVEWYENGPDGLEQGFTVARRRPGAGPLVLELSIAGAKANLVAQTVTLETDTGPRLTYDGLVTRDRSGAVVPSRIEVPDPATIRLVVDDRDSVYPVVIDPVVSGAFDAMMESNVPDPPGFRPVAFGYWVHGAGDVNGDGFDDVIVGSPNYDNGEFFEGAAFVFLGSAAGIVGSDPATAHAVLDANQSAARLGTVASAGDVNGDGYGDVMVGAPDYSTLYLPDPSCQCEVNGAVFVFHGGPSGISGTDPSNADAVILGNSLGSDLGAWLSGVGDVNGDGFDDIAISVPSHGTPFPPAVPPNQRSGNYGAVLVYHGGPEGIIGTNFDDADHVILPYEDNGLPEPPLYGQISNVDGAGDVNGDGYDDIVTGGDELRLFLGGPNGVVGGDILAAASRVDADPELGIADSIGGPGTGIQARGAGDINGDGFDDVVGGLLGYTIPGSGPREQGQIFAILGGPSGLGIQDVSSAHFLLTGSLGGEWLGWGVDGAGDVDGDGFSDVVATARVYPGSFDSEGVVYLFRGGPQGIPVNTLLDADARLEARQSAATTEADLSGIPVASAGDVNGDGFADVIGGKPVWDGPELNEGAAFVWHGEAWPPTPNRFPVAHAGADQVLFDEDNDGVVTVTFDGSDSFDPDGSIVAYEWYEGEALLGIGSVISATLSAVGDHIVALVVTDDQGVRRGDLVRVRIEPPQTDFLYFDNFDLGLIEWTTSGDVNLSSLDTFPEPPQVRFAGTGAAMWRSFALPLGATGAAPDFWVKLVSMAPGDRFVVKGSVDGGPFEEMLVLTDADATGDYVFYGGSGTPTSVPVNMSWWPATGSSFELRFEADLTTGVAFLDSFDIEALIVPVGNTPPIAQAGPDQSVPDTDGNGFERVALDGSGSSDPDGSIYSYEWRKDGSTLANSVSASANFGIGQHTVTLIVTDDRGGSDRDTVLVTVTAEGNQPPRAVAGPDQSASDQDRDGFESFTLDGGGSSDPDGAIVSYEWREGGNLLGTGAVLPVTLPVGSHTIDLIVTDNEGAIDSDIVVITVTQPEAPAEPRSVLVEGVDPVSGTITVNYDPACPAADHNVVYGLLSEVGSYAYTGQKCSIGTSGRTEFNPGPESYFFLVVGTDGAAVDGSYGQSSRGVERPEDLADPVCSFMQQIGSPCTPTDTAPPEVTVTHPSEGAELSGTVRIDADASDDVAVTEVHFYIDSVQLAIDRNAPYSADWDTTLEPDGAHEISAAAFDAAGNRGDSAVVNVTTSNAELSVSIELTGVPESIERGQFFVVFATARNNGATTATGLTAEINWNPQDPLRLENPQSTTQSYGPLGPGGEETVQWEFRAEREGASLITVTLRDGNSTVLGSDSGQVEVLD